MYYYASIEFAVNITRNHQGKPGAGLTWGEYPNAESCDITAAPGVASVVTNRNTCSYINRHPREKLGSLPEIAEEKCPSFGRSYLFVRKTNTSRCQTRSKGVDNDSSLFYFLLTRSIRNTFAREIFIRQKKNNNNKNTDYLCLSKYLTRFTIN